MHAENISDMGVGLGSCILGHGSVFFRVTASWITNRDQFDCSLGHDFELYSLALTLAYLSWQGLGFITRLGLRLWSHISYVSTSTTVISTLRWAVLTVLWIGFCHTGPISLCVIYLCLSLCILCVVVSYSMHICIIVSTVGWSWWDWSLILRTYLPSVLWHC